MYNQRKKKTRNDWLYQTSRMGKTSDSLRKELVLIKQFLTPSAGNMKDSYHEDVRGGPSRDLLGHHRT